MLETEQAGSRWRCGFFRSGNDPNGSLARI
jgi:hypothetical protein